jgi:hypothetical protein
MNPIRVDPIRADILSYPWNARILDATGRVRHRRLLVSRENLRKYPTKLPGPLARKLLWRLQLVIFLPMLLPMLILFLVWVALDPLRYLLEPLRHVRGISTSFAILATAAAAIYTIGWTPMRRIYRRAHTAALLEARRCSWCLYDLDALPPNGAGLTTCPECGGAWALARDQGAPSLAGEAHWGGREAVGRAAGGEERGGDAGWGTGDAVECRSEGGGGTGVR